MMPAQMPFIIAWGAFSVKSSPLSLHNLNLLIRQVVEFIDHPVDFLFDS